MNNNTTPMRAGRNKISLNLNQKNEKSNEKDNLLEASDQEMEDIYPSTNLSSKKPTIELFL